MNGEVRAPSRAKITAFYSGDKEVKLELHQSKTERWHQGGKAETSAETGERSKYQQHQRYVATDSEFHRLQKQVTIICETSSADELINLLNKESVVKSTPPSEERLLSVSIADARRILLRVNMCEATGPDPRWCTKNMPIS